MKYLGKVQQDKDLVNVEYVSEVDTQIRSDLSPLIEDATEVIVSDTEPTGKNKRVLWIDPSSSGSSDEGKEVVVSPTRPDSFTAWIDTSATYNDTNSTIAVIDGGTGAKTATNARSNLQVALKPKLLWSGSFASGSITVPGFSDYLLYAFVSSLSDSIYVLGGDWGGIGGLGVYGNTKPTILSYRFSISNNTLTITTYDKGMLSWDTTSGTSITATTTKIYGLVRKDDILGV